MIFPKLYCEKVLQVKDKTRIDATTSFSIEGANAITDVEIQPSAADSFVSVFNDGDPKKWFLDWAYQVDGDAIVTLKITDDTLTEYTESFTINVVTEEDDYLFSSDQNLISKELDIRKYIPKGRNTWKDKHRDAQRLIVDHLNDQGITNLSGGRLTKDAIVDIEEVRKWSTYLVLYLIFEDIKVTEDDVFAAKSSKYETLSGDASEKAFIRLDTSGDGNEDTSKNLITTRLIRRG